MLAPFEGRQVRSPQRNLIDMIDQVIRSPYTGPVVTSMNAFLGRNRLSRPARQSIRQQFRENAPASSSSRPSSPFSNVQDLFGNSIDSRPILNRPVRDDFRQQGPPAIGSSSSTFRSQPPTRSSVSSALQPQVFNPIPVRPNFNSRPPPRLTQNSPRASGFQPSPPLRQRQNPVRNSNQREAPTPSTEFEPSFNFQNGVFSSQFESKRIKRDLQNNMISEDSFASARQSSGSSFTDSISSMFTNIRESIPSNFEEIREFLGFDSTDRADRDPSRGDNFQYITSGGQSVPLPVSIPARPSYMIMPEHPFTQSIGQQSYKRSLFTDSENFSSASKSRSKREAQRPKRRPHHGKKNGQRSIMRLAPIRIPNVSHLRNVAPAKPKRNLRRRPLRKTVRANRPPLKLRNILESPTAVNYPKHIAAAKPSPQLHQHPNLVKVTHKPKGVPPVETSSHAVIHNEYIEHSKNSPLVEIKFDDLPVIDHGRGNQQRLRQIEELIRLHNIEVNGYNQAKFDSAPTVTTLNNVLEDVKVFPAPAAPQSSVYKREMVESGKGLSGKDKISPKPKPTPLLNLKPRTEPPHLVPDIRSSFPVFPEINFLKNFHSDFEDPFSSLNHLSSVQVTEGTPEILESFTPSVASHTLFSEDPHVELQKEIEQQLHFEEFVKNSEPKLHGHYENVELIGSPPHPPLLNPQQLVHQVQGPVHVAHRPQQFVHRPIHHAPLPRRPVSQNALLVTIPPQEESFQALLYQPHSAPRFAHPRSRPLPPRRRHPQLIGHIRRSEDKSFPFSESKSGLAFLPGPAPVAAILPSYAMVEAPAHVVRKNRRRSKELREDPPSRKKRSIELSLSRDFKSQMFPDSFGECF